MNLENLEDAQDEMRERWEIRQNVERSDLVCMYCDKNPTRASKRTGEVLPCSQCKRRYYYMREKHPDVPFALKLMRRFRTLQ